jgi:hypothetical protein
MAISCSCPPMANALRLTLRVSWRRLASDSLGASPIPLRANVEASCPHQPSQLKYGPGGGPQREKTEFGDSLRFLSGEARPALSQAMLTLSVASLPPPLLKTIRNFPPPKPPNHPHMPA